MKLHFHEYDIFKECIEIIHPRRPLQNPVQVNRWRIYGEIGFGGILVFEAPTTGEIIVTSSIEYLSPESGILLTSSGKLYVLMGEQAENAFDFVHAMTLPGAETKGF